MPSTHVRRSVLVLWAACVAVASQVWAQSPELVLSEIDSVQLLGNDEPVRDIERFTAWGHQSFLIRFSSFLNGDYEQVLWGSLDGAAPQLHARQSGMVTGEPSHLRLRGSFSIVGGASGEAAVFLGDEQGEAGFLMSLRRGAGEIGVEGSSGPAPGTWSYFATPTGTRIGETWFLGGTCDEPEPTGYSRTDQTALFRASATTVTRVIGGGDAVGTLTLRQLDGITRQFRVSDGGSHWLAVAVVSDSDGHDRVVLANGLPLSIAGGLIRIGSDVTASGAQAFDKWHSFLDLAVNDVGSWVLAAMIGNELESRWVLVRDGAIIAEQDGIVDGLTLGATVNGVVLNNDGDVAFTAVDKDQELPVLVLNESVAMSIGDPIDEDGDGVAEMSHSLAALSGGRQNFLSDRDAQGYVTLWTRGEVQRFDLVDQPVYPVVLKHLLPHTGPWICPADFDGDGTLTLFDFLAFQTAFDAGEPSADFDGNGIIDMFDILAFQTAFQAGCS